MSVERFASSQEAKYSFYLGDADGILQALQQLCIPDPSFAYGRINSAYYDTFDRRFLGEKVNSDYLKTKVRLRWYDDPSATSGGGPVTAYLERKEKIGTRRYKERSPVQVDRAALAEGREDFRELARVIEAAGFEDWVAPSQLFPMIVIRYQRHRFVDPSRTARLSLDTRIGYSSVNPIFVPVTEPRMLREGVLEVKSESGHIPAALHRLRDRLCTRDSFSKYEECWQIHADVFYRRGLKSQGI